jgi:hypothetical protein
MSSKPPRWPPLWDWFDPDEIIESVRSIARTPQNKDLLELLENIIPLQLEPAKFIHGYPMRPMPAKPRAAHLRSSPISRHPHSPKPCLKVPRAVKEKEPASTFCFGQVLTFLGAPL